MTLKYGDIWEDLIKSHQPLRTKNHLRLVAEEGSRESQSRRETRHTIPASRWGYLRRNVGSLPELKVAPG